MNKCLSSQDFDSLLERNTPPAHLAGMKQHLRLCDTCAARLARRRASISPPTVQTVTSHTHTQETSLMPVGLEPNVEIGDFRIERRLGSGGMGIVYLAHQISLNRPVALKVLSVNPLTAPSVIERFHREAQAVAKLRHPHIVAIYEERVEQNLCYYAMELVEGQSLAHYIQELPTQTGLTKSLGRSRYDGFARIVATLAEALHYAHQRGVIHRDIKPSNIMITPDGRPMLMDFGIARLLDDPGMTMTSTFLGTPLYMSPEQIGARSEELDARTDIYSLGATLYELITQHALYEGLKTRQQIIGHMLRKPFKRPRQIDDHIPMDMETICLKALEFDPAERYQTAGDMADDLTRYLNHQVIKAKPAGPLKRISKLIVRHKAVSVLLVIAVLTAAVAAFIYQQDAQNRKIGRLLPALRQHVEQDEFFNAYLLAVELEKLNSREPQLLNTWSLITCEHKIVTTPVNADVYMQNYFDPNGPWIPLGRTPIPSIRLPYGTNRFRVQATVAGYTSIECAIYNKLPYRTQTDTGDPSTDISWTLHPSEQIPSDMVWIPGQDLSQNYVFHGTHKIENDQAFFIDKYEVSNKAYQAFVDAGGYENPAFWEQPFVKDGVTLSWEQAMALFVDQSCLPGPATWINGKYPPGKVDYPVGGLSWFEAAAHARYCGKELPTAYHWLLASSAKDSNAGIATLSNFSGHPSPCGQFPGLGRYGLYDVAGNVREWATNAIIGNEDLRCIMGGTYNSQDYEFSSSTVISPWDRSEFNGLRCIDYIGGRHGTPPDAFEPLEYRQRDWDTFKLISPETFEEYRQTLYAYDDKPLYATIEKVDYEMEICRRERVTFDATYQNERMIAYIHLPLNSQPPYQTVVWHPGATAPVTSWDQYKKHYHHILIKLISRGYAVVIPIYKNTYERRLDTTSWQQFGLQSRNLTVQRTQDFSRTLDYLMTRADIDHDKMAYVGLSWGASDAPRYLAHEKRIRTAVLYHGGLCACTEQRQPSVDPAQFAPYVKIPVLMINGRNDINLQYATAQKPLYDLLGTPPQDKKHIQFPGGHTLPAEIDKKAQQAVFDWLIEYMGPVETTEN